MSKTVGYLMNKYKYGIRESYGGRAGDELDQKSASVAAIYNLLMGEGPYKNTAQHTPGERERCLNSQATIYFYSINPDTKETIVSNIKVRMPQRGNECKSCNTLPTMFGEHRGKRSCTLSDMNNNKVQIVNNVDTFSGNVVGSTIYSEKTPNGVIIYKVIKD